MEAHPAYRSLPASSSSGPSIRLRSGKGQQQLPDSSNLAVQNPTPLMYNLGQPDLLYGGQGFATPGYDSQGSPVSQFDVQQFLTNPVSRVAMSYSQSLVEQGKDLVHQYVQKYIASSGLKYYFKVDTDYVAKKLGLLLYPYSQVDWSVHHKQDFHNKRKDVLNENNKDDNKQEDIQINQDVQLKEKKLQRKQEDVQINQDIQLKEKKLRRRREDAQIQHEEEVLLKQEDKVKQSYDINTPDLYIPVMAFVTYNLVSGLVLGVQGRFSPELLGGQMSSSLAMLLLELLIFWTSLQVLNLKSLFRILDVSAYCGYKFVGMTITLLAGIIFNKLMFYLVLLWFCASLVYFLIHSLGVPAESTHSAMAPVFILGICSAQPLLMWWLTNSVMAVRTGS